MSLRSTKKRLAKLEARLRKREAAELPKPEHFINGDGHEVFRQWYVNDAGEVEKLDVIIMGNIDLSKL